jgi:hypothetical protein
MVHKFAGRFTAGYDALNRHRRGEPGVTVQNLSITDGSQAIVGNVTQNRGDPADGKGSTAPGALPQAAEEIIGEFTEVLSISPRKRKRSGR